MLSPFICGCGAPHNQYDEDMETLSPPYSSPKSSRKSTSFIRRRDNGSKNPYSGRGLDKFSELLADLEDKRKKIYTQIGGPEDVSYVRFFYSNSNDCKPIVVRVKNHKKMEETHLENDPNRPLNHASEASNDQNHEVEGGEEEEQQPRVELEKRICKMESFKKDMMRLFDWRQPLVLVLMLILVLLVVFGRSFAILCTSIFWYLAPSLKGKSGIGSNSMKKKVSKKYLRGFSENRIASDGTCNSPRSVLHGLGRQRHHRGSW